ncbi:unnamed protein product, partial [Darwinula stevensoni]
RISDFRDRIHLTGPIRKGDASGFQLGSFFSRYASRPVTKKFDWTYRGEAVYPSITVCQENGFKPKVAREYLKPGVTMSSYPIKDWDFGRFANEREFLDAIDRSFFHLDETIHRCYLSGRPCSSVGRWTEKRTESHGLCHTFLPDPDKPMPTGGGSRQGYLLNFTVGDHWFCDAKDPVC